SVDGAEPLGVALPFTQPGKPHSWDAPNMPTGWNDARLCRRWHAELAPALAKALGNTGRGVFACEKGPRTNVTLLQVRGGRDVAYVVAVNDSSIHTQADWFQVSEKLRPTGPADDARAVYDCTAERLIGAYGPLTCDMTGTTARLFAVASRRIAEVDLRATQRATAGEDVILSVAFTDKTGRPLEAVIPFELALVRPDGTSAYRLFRATNADGRLRLALPLGVNVPTGGWTLVARCLLDGRVALLAVTVQPARRTARATALRSTVVVRRRAAIRKLLSRGARVVLPVWKRIEAPDDFHRRMQDVRHNEKVGREDAGGQKSRPLRPVEPKLQDNPMYVDHLAAAKRIRQVLAKLGVEAEIRDDPAMATYWLAYRATASQEADNRRVENGTAIGRIVRTTVNRNDWFSGASEFRFSRPVILLDLVGAPDNPMAEALDRLGALWPRATAAFPGKGKAVVQLVHWAFAPQTPALVIQAADPEGLSAAAEALTDLPEDVLSTSIEGARAALWAQHFVGGRPEQPEDVALTAEQRRAQVAP
ncbi:MAG: hypothetical protein WBF17_03480, partial [Phycisphaerae bacterium]